MARIVYIHWHESELLDRIRPLVGEGHEVVPHWSQGTPAPIREPYPDVLVVSLDRLPSHGRSCAEWFWEAKKRRSIPLVFEGGPAGKVEAIRAKFPAVHHCETGGVAAVLRTLSETVSQGSEEAR